MRVWIDQKACIGNGVCEDVCPEVFMLVDGDIAYVRDGDRLLPEGEAGALSVPSPLEIIPQTKTHCSTGYPGGCE